LLLNQSSHKYLYQELEASEKLGQMKHLQSTHWTGKERRTLSYRYVNEVTLKDSEDSIKVNWLELSISNDQGKILFRNSYVTSYFLSEENVAEVAEAGRCRWKIENEDFNTLKTKGYHFEHNFGHGKRYLSQTLLSLNLLAFLFHTVLEILDERCAWLRKTLARRDTFFQHIAALTQYPCFANWQSLLWFMMRALQDGPAPPPDPSVIIKEP
jgi:hypothetical protein